MIEDDRFLEMFKMQHTLQVKSMKDGDPTMLRGDDRATFIVWNTTAAVDELHEAMAETGWKPWATSRHVNGEAMTKELVDAWHFIMNLMMIASSELHMTLDEYAEFFYRKYIDKNAVNAARMADGYDGVSTKCPQCKRELSETNLTLHRMIDLNGVETTVCSPRCLLHMR